ncbi:GntR family transcriptional regulator [Leucobacter soli]|uniref:GntR family transcriptional regulator n=1 Tax=Leucobacter soli TaxID=2812850 RepID=UPI003609A3B1
MRGHHGLPRHRARGAPPARGRRAHRLRAAQGDARGLALAHRGEEHLRDPGQLEGLACRLFAEHADSAQLGALVSTVDRLSRAVDDPSTMLAEKSRFYDVLFDGAGNPELRRILEGLRQRITLLRVNSLAIPGRPVHSLQEIEKIRDAIVARNGELAEELCRQHIRAAADAVLSAPEAHFDESE